MVEGLIDVGIQHLNKKIGNRMEYKGYKIEADGCYGYKSIKPIGRGSVPVKLRGLYTSAIIAQKDIDAHLERSDKSGKAKTSE